MKSILKNNGDAAHLLPEPMHLVSISLRRRHGGI